MNKNLNSILSSFKQGHKILCDKQVLLKKQFLSTIRETHNLRKTVNASIKNIHAAFTFASAVSHDDISKITPPIALGQLRLKYKKVAGLSVPEYTYDFKMPAVSEIYGFVFTSAEHDYAFGETIKLTGVILKLAEMEKTTYAIADEIEKIRARIRFLEKIAIPRYNVLSKKSDACVRGLSSESAARMFKCSEIIMK